MQVEIQYFGQLTDFTGTQKEFWNLSEGISTSEFLEQLYLTYEQFKGIPIKLAINAQISHENHPLKPNDIISVLPPYSGG